MLVALAAAGGCAEGSVARRDVGPLDATADVGTPDAGRRDSATADVGPPDAPSIDAGPIGLTSMCSVCTNDSQCVPGAVCVPLGTGASAQRLCLYRCAGGEFPRCEDPVTRVMLPDDFVCATPETRSDAIVCFPGARGCCVDFDGDGYGEGAGCDGPDCDDGPTGAARNPSVSESCDGTDNDCDGRTDEQATDCAAARCERAGSSFQAVEASVCTQSACAQPTPTSCGLYTCDEAELLCAITCDVMGVDSDMRCVTAAHCEDGACEPDAPPGSVCDEDSDCTTSRCEGGFCCGPAASSAAECCATDTDCSQFGMIAAVCQTNETCQGTRGMVSCNPTTFACDVATGIADDSACDGSRLASACGLFRDVFCDGTADQRAPTCASTCDDDADCDDGAHCEIDGPVSSCVADLAPGQPCDEPSDCAGGYCANGFCCVDDGTGAVCCGTSADCPARFSTSPACDDPRGCQGTRDVAVCLSSRCATMADVADDSACTGGAVADGCDLYPAVRCNGQPDQLAPACATSCGSDSECDSEAHCDDGLCVRDLVSGSSCDEDSDCTTGRCRNGFCCAGGDCCRAASDCPASYTRPAICNDPSTCQGQRQDAACTNFECELGPMVDDDSGCAGLVSNACGLFPSVSCTAMASQPPNQASRCATTCPTSPCDPGAFCNASGACESQGLAGSACVTSAQCSAPLSCVDGVCCTSACTGSCEACNVAGRLGECSPVPAGTDPQNECGNPTGIDCSTYFAGWMGDVCADRRDLAPSEVSCNGNRACQSAADLCPMQPRGDVRRTCDPTCQDPNLGTCTGAIEGICTDVSPGTTGCGRGACAVTVPQCIAGAPNACIPGMPVAEMCNSIDDDCDGTPDNNVASTSGISTSIFESNNTCGQAAGLPSIDTNDVDSGMEDTTDAEIRAMLYPTGDGDFYRLVVNDVDAPGTPDDCGACCFGNSNERVSLRLQLSVPAGAGSYELCAVRDLTAGTSCSTLEAMVPADPARCITVPAGSASSLTVVGDGAMCPCIWQIICGTFVCPPGDNTETYYVRVRPTTGSNPGSSCQPYTLTYSATEECYNPLGPP